jgi:hypothetical protein
MANSSHSYPIISESQASKATTANGMDLAGSPALLWGIDPPNTAGLTLGLLEGCLNVAGTPTQIAATTVSLTGGATNYVEATTAGVVSANTSAFTGGRLRLYTVVCGASSITSHIDHRNTATFAGITSAIGTGDVVGPASSTDSHFAQFDGITGKLLKGGLALDTDAALAANSNTKVPTQAAVKSYVDGKVTQCIAIACSDETTALAAGTAKTTFRMPFAFTLTAVRASLTTAQTSGSIFTVDINETGTTILSTKLTVDNTEKTSTTAAAAAVISDSSLADDAEITIDIDQIGDGTAKGLKVYLIGTKT